MPFVEPPRGMVLLVRMELQSVGLVLEWPEGGTGVVHVSPARADPR